MVLKNEPFYELLETWKPGDLEAWRPAGPGDLRPAGLGSLTTYRSMYPLEQVEFEG